MAFSKKTWKDRIVEFPARRLLKNIATGERTIVDVSRNEGIESQAGDTFSAANMNNLEDRISSEFSALNTRADGSSTSISNINASINGINTNLSSLNSRIQVEVKSQAQYNAMGSGRPYKVYVIVG